MNQSKSDELTTGIIEFDLINKKYKTIKFSQFLDEPIDKMKVYWIHCHLSHSDELKKLASKIELPEETLQLCLQKNTLSKLIDHNTSLTLKFQCILEKVFDKNKMEHFGNIVMYLTNQYCFTAAEQPIPALLEFKNHCHRTLKFAKTPCFILFLIMDYAMNDYAQFLFNFEVISDQMDIKVRENHENIYSDLIDTKHRVMEIKRCTVATREILMRLSGKKIGSVSEECRESLINLFNQSQMLFHEVDSIRDVLNGLMSQIDYSLALKMNKTMQILTAFAAIFLPLTLIAAIYGMNFVNMPELKWEYGYYYALALIFFTGLGLWTFFKRSDWF